MEEICLIAAIGEYNHVIGAGGELPWSRELTPDMDRFKELTMGCPVVMGRCTWESIPEKFRPLPGRFNIVVTQRRDAEFSGARTAYSVHGAICLARSHSKRVFVIGGEQIYRSAMKEATRLYLTIVNENPLGDAFFPEYSEFTKVVELKTVPDFVPRLTFLTLERS